MSFSRNIYHTSHKFLKSILNRYSFVRLDRWADAGRNVYFSPHYRYFRPEFIVSSSGSMNKSNAYVLSYEQELAIRQANIDDWYILKLHDIRHRTHKPLLVLPFVSSEGLESALDNKNDILLQNSQSISSLCESKEMFRTILKNSGISGVHIPKTISLQNKPNIYEDIVHMLKVPFFVQEQSRGGKGTYLIRTHDEFYSLINRNLVKATQVISGNVYNFTAVIIPKPDSSGCSVITYTPSFKPMNIAKLGGGHFSSVGNEYCPYIVCANDIIQDIIHIGTHLYERYNYIGLFGLDVIIDKGNYHFIEINARCQGTTEVSAAVSEMSDEIPAIVLHTMAMLGINPTTDDEVILHNQNVAAKLTLRNIRHPFYIKIKAKENVSFVASGFCRTGIYEYNQNGLIYISPTPRTLDGNIGDGKFVLTNVPSCNTKIIKNMDICMIEGVIENDCIFESDTTLSTVGDRLVDQAYSIIARSCSV